MFLIRTRIRRIQYVFGPPGSVCQRYGSEEQDPHPDPYQNVTDSHHGISAFYLRFLSEKTGSCSEKYIKNVISYEVHWTKKYNYIFGENNDIFSYLNSSRRECAADNQFIRVETCMFMVKLPRYSTYETMRDKLLYAISCALDPLSG